ncbi:unnamed protein product (macronuclear) [Paramecium tetraurelia]|uniref:Uncharacterized protein n=1 Tax=Paramecium tetraurelia TaxID=5888 RepID=A0BTT0_PARTE|nr:uncharacterized protein GSPATT00032179001 [Paramecium tetraurelia]CAK61947.1 unnamed protein product [Paramecium tetraurelia]|eukprot:XP_001429345.1 hypothetical protein (macronuclear) [Paramecium tetraurelia strain d4-2]
MGPPPNYIITRKLIRHFFRKYLPQQPITKGNEGEDLAQAVSKYGIDHPQTKIALDRFDSSEAESLKYRKKLEAMKIQQKVMSTLKTPFYHYHEKGRFRNDLFPKEWTIFHGVK